jgi:hypothetical protein
MLIDGNNKQQCPLLQNVLAVQAWHFDYHISANEMAKKKS